ncbi:MAG: GNAT family N-acetyltransferase [Candidatus Limnocylindria bacterium]
MPLSLHRFDDVHAFLDRAGDFLVAREAEHNLMLGISSYLRDHPELVEHAPTLMVVTDDDDGVVAASVRTPPFNQVISMVDDLAAVDLIADALRDEDLPGVLAPTDVAARFAERWTALTGQPARVDVAERIFRLDRVIPPARPAAGSWRLVESRDRERIARWAVAFQEEVEPSGPPIDDPLAMADRWVARIGRLGYVWEDGGAVVSLVGASGETPHGIRIGPVYTPPELRGRGYASALTAAASQDQLDRGRRFVFLFTDLSNPTSNKIYRAIGYEAVCDVDQHRFGADA